MNYSILASVINILIFLLILYISIHSQITKDEKFRIPFWTMIIFMIFPWAWFHCQYPDLRTILLIEFSISIVIIYFLNFRKRIKSRLDYLKLTWLLLFLTDVLTINLMNYLIIKDVKIALINSEMVIVIERMFDITILVYSMVVAGIIYNNVSKQKQSIEGS